ncbi:50S ribosomal protein L10 [Magnetofaba australis]|uniref:Large ribosomal subunit protein uL10 n=1 Tax=Magnetofaba australis IT-1 TaxID=1434232 RepID=A0A1Y2K308_9PROT|nr:50S ribosomal protein L10 [Magnetofaba australis]OSM02440.1 putative 50S ribosomal protein L10 [Magnetofaba australis IT-1]
MNKAEKSSVIEEVKETFSQSSVALVAHYRGLSVAEMTELRVKMRDAGAELRVVKNTLARRAASEAGIENLNEFLVGPTSIATCSDPVAPAKVFSEFAKDHKKLEILGGVLDGERIDPAGIERLAKLPPKEVLVAQLLGVMNGPIRGFATVLNAIPSGFVRALDQIRQQKEGAEA